MSKTAARFALLCALVGLGASVAAAYVHYHLLFDPDLHELLRRQRDDQLHAGLPEPLQHVPRHPGRDLRRDLVRRRGAAVGRPADRRGRRCARACPGICSSLSTLALAVVLYLGYASFVLLKAVCVLCLITYAAVIGLFLVSGAATSFPMTTLPRRAAQDFRVFVGSPLAIVARRAVLRRRRVDARVLPARRRDGAGADRRSRADADRRISAPSSSASWRRAPRVPLVVPTDGAKVLVVKFNDFQCPACGQSYLQYKPILAKYEATHPGAVKLVLKDYPLNPDCNDDDRADDSPGGVRRGGRGAARAAHNKAEAMEEWLYTHQPEMTPPIGAPGGARHRTGHRLRREVRSRRSSS